ncbi:MAG: sodium-translocating pyrophosphatase [bacterium]|nr:sodium-translocating pyrophosphatase [Candidatus Sumerlaeota bacterium]
MGNVDLAVAGKIIFAVVMVISLGSLAVAYLLARWVLNKDTGTPEMRHISDSIKEGAEAFLRRQNMTIFALSVLVAVLIFAGYYFLAGDQEKAIRMTVSYLAGALCSGIAGYVGMYVSIRANIRTASAARTSLNDALRIALRGGAVSGILVVALSLLGVGALFGLFGGLAGEGARHVPSQIVGFGFGASFVALFAQLGGGIYTKAADVGADLVGKVEAGIPEDDPRNPAVIADLVGDNVGDCAGRGADLFESTAAENIGAMILGIALYPIFGIKGILFPLLARALGIIASIIGIYSVSVKGDEDPMKSLNRGYFITTIGAFIAFGLACFIMFSDQRAPSAWIWFLACGLVGIVTSYMFVWITQYYTEYRYRPVQQIAEACKTGPATTIIQGFAVGLECTFYPVIVICGAILLSYWMGGQAIAQLITAGVIKAENLHAGGGLYGTAVATMGMLSTAAYILAMDTFGPITDNAGGIVEMSNQPESVRDKTDRLDSVGNTTKALTKGYAVGSAALAAFLLFSAYLDEVKMIVESRPWAKALSAEEMKELIGKIYTVDIGQPAVFVGGFVGAMLVFLFSAFAIKAVGRVAQTVIEEVRRQFKANPLIMEKKADPDYRTCVDIVTRGALKAMVVPGIMPVIFPLVVGLIIRFAYKDQQVMAAQAVAALLMVGTIAGILMALLMNNGGGAWDNAKKYIEAGAYGGKRSDAHKASIVGDTVGDPFKDTAGPSLHVLIKLLSTLTLVMAPLFIR